MSFVLDGERQRNEEVGIEIKMNVYEWMCQRKSERESHERWDKERYTSLKIRTKGKK